MQERQGNILIVDDNKEFLLGLKMLLSPYFKDVVVESNPEKIISHIDNQNFDLVILDMNFRAGLHAGNEGFFWMDKIQNRNSDVRIVFITGYGDVELAVESMKKGASDFIEKSWDERKILSTVLANFRLSQSMNQARIIKQQRQSLSESVIPVQKLCRGISSSMGKIMEIIEKVGPTDADILITGESGTGKEVIAHHIHNVSTRAGEIFMPVDINHFTVFF